MAVGQEKKVRKGVRFKKSWYRGRAKRDQFKA